MILTETIFLKLQLILVKIRTTTLLKDQLGMVMEYTEPETTYLHVNDTKRI